MAIFIAVALWSQVPAVLSPGDVAGVSTTPANEMPDLRLAFAGPDDDSKNPSRNSSLRDRAIEAIKNHRFSEAETLIHEGRKTRSSRKKDQWTIVESRLELEKGEFANAGLIAMNVVILRHKSDEVAAALYWAARAYEGLGRPAKAIQLYEECRTHSTAPDSLVKVASRRIDQLRESQDKS